MGDNIIVWAVVIAGLILFVWWVRKNRADQLSTPTSLLTPTIAVTPDSRRSSAGRLTPLGEVTPIPTPAGWPITPEQPPGLDGRPDDAPYVEVADRPYDRTTCPSCAAELSPLPKAKKRCPACGREIFVRSGPDNRRYLLSSSELATWDQRWVAHYQAQSVEALQRQELAEAEWHRRLTAAGVTIGDEELDVVGESYYHAQLAGIRAALNAQPRDFEVRTIAALVAEPNNQYDRNAVGVYVHGVKVGHLDRYDAAEYQPPIRRAGGQIYVEAVMLGGQPTPQGEIGPIGVRLMNVPAIQ